MALEEPLSHPPVQNYGISKSTLQKLDGLPLLDAVMMESLRLRNPIRMPAFRTVPQGGAVIDGFFLPGGTVVSASTYALHMNPDAFPEPHKWVPERWFNLSDEKIPGASDDGEAEKGRDTNDPRRWFWTFISGSNMCLGNNFSVLVMKLIVATIYTNYTTYVIDDEGIEQVDGIFACPVGEKLILGFNRLPKA